MASPHAIPLGRARAQVECVGARLQPGSPARPAELRGHPGRRLASAHRYAVRHPRRHDGRARGVVAAALQPPGPGAERMAGVLPQARRRRHRASGARRTARLFDSRCARAPRGAPLHPADRRALHPPALRGSAGRQATRRAGTRAAPPGARAPSDMRGVLIFVVTLLFCFGVEAQAAEPAKYPAYSKRPEVRAYIRELVARHGFVEKELVYLFSRVRREDAVLTAIAAPAEKVRTWQDYREILVNERRIAGGVAFWKTHRAALARAERDFGVPAEYIVAIIGVET